MKNIALILLLGFFIGPAQASDRHIHGVHGHAEEHNEEEADISPNVGDRFAVTEASHEDGFKLSNTATANLGIETQAVLGDGRLRFPKSSLVAFKDKTAVYRFREGWYKRIEGVVRNEDGDMVFVPNSKESFKAGDRVVVSGVPLLRVTELDVFSGAGEGHAH